MCRHLLEYKQQLPVCDFNHSIVKFKTKVFFYIDFLHVHHVILPVYI